MSDADRDKWNTRYRAGEYQARPHPSALLTEWLPRLPTSAPLTAADVACGRGRNALYLAGLGWQVDAYDISAVALTALAKAAAAQALPVHGVEIDLDDAEGRAELFGRERYHLALLVRYTDLTLLPTLIAALRPGGYLIVEEHLVSEEDVIGPTNPRFRVHPGALATAAADLEVLCCREGLVTDPDGRTAALAQLVARKPPATPREAAR